MMLQNTHLLTDCLDLGVLNLGRVSIYVTLIPVRVSDTIRIGYVDTHFPKKTLIREYG